MIVVAILVGGALIAWALAAPMRQRYRRCCAIYDRAKATFAAAEDAAERGDRAEFNRLLALHSRLLDDFRREARP